MPGSMVDVRSRREELELSQESLAQAVGVSVSTVRRWENGMEPRGRTRRRLARVLAVLEADLTFGDETVVRHGDAVQRQADANSEHEPS